MREHDPVQDIGLFATIFLPAGLLPAIGDALPERIVTGQTVLVVLVHMWVSIHTGTFGGWRRVTWMLLTGSTVGAMLAGFLGYILPWGQMTYWLAGLAVSLPFAAPAVQGWTGGQAWSAFSGAAGAAALAILGTDVVLMHRARWRGETAALLRLVAAAVVAAIAVGLVLSRLVPVDPEPTPGLAFAILPDWWLLPPYAILRAIPDKLAGVAILFAIVAAPAVWPWAQADALRAASPKAWLAACAGMAAAWIGLGMLGGREADRAGIAAARVLILLYASFFVIIPVLGRRTPRHPAE